MLDGSWGRKGECSVGGPVDKAYLVDSFGFQEIEFNVEKEERFIPYFDLTLAAQAEASL